MEIRIPFDIKYRPEIEAGKYLVVTRDGREVRISRWLAGKIDEKVNPEKQDPIINP